MDMSFIRNYIAHFETACRVDSSRKCRTMAFASEARFILPRRVFLTMLGTSASLGGAVVDFPPSLEKRALADTLPEFVRTPSGLLIQDLRKGQGQEPKDGDRVEIEWEGFTKGYQGKRFGNSSRSGVTFEFVLGAAYAIPAIEEAVKGMAVGGIRRLEVRGEIPELSYARDRNERFTNEIFFDKIYKYKKGPQPTDLGGQRALDFVLDNPTLQDFNRTLLFDIKLVSVRTGQ